MAQLGAKTAAKAAGGAKEAGGKECGGGGEVQARDWMAKNTSII